jgi:hypothetical protein
MSSGIIDDSRLRIRKTKPVNEREVNTQFGQQFDSARLHFEEVISRVGKISQEITLPK